MKTETEELLKQRDEVEENVRQFEMRWIVLAEKICDIEGQCPRCQNWHYPHCQSGVWPK